MKIVVCVKQAVTVPNFLEFDASGTDVDPAFVSRELNEPDSYAVEEALRVRDTAEGSSEVVVLTVGDEDSDEVLRSCLALGADRAVRVWSDALSPHDPIGVARALASAARSEDSDLVLCGVQSSDAAQQSTGPALGSAMGLPCVTVATKLEMLQDRPDIVVHREFEGGLAETVEVSRPAVITVQTGLNIPRYGSFKEKLRAKKASIPVVDPGEVGTPRATVRRMSTAESDNARDVEYIDGGPTEVATRIAELVREVGS